METVRVIINKSYGGFCVSQKAIKEYNSQMKKINPQHTDVSQYAYEISRYDPILVSIVEKMGKKANGDYSELEIVDIPKEYIHFMTIHEYDGVETIKVDFEKYRIAKIREIINSTDDFEMQHNKIKIILEQTMKTNTKQ